MTRSFSGFVIDGRGLGCTTVGKHAEQLARLLGADPYPGTLNVILNEPVLLRVDRMSLRMKEHAYWRGQLLERDCLFNRWHGCPLHILEIVSSERLRNLLPEHGGVEITIDDDVLAPLTSGQRASWRQLWQASPASFYDDEYRAELERRKDNALMLSCQTVNMPGYQ